MKGGAASVMLLEFVYVKRSDTRKKGGLHKLCGTSLCRYLTTGNSVETEVPERNEDTFLKSFSDNIKVH